MKFGKYERFSDSFAQCSNCHFGCSLVCHFDRREESYKASYWLKIPCVTLRDETEWVETVAAGWNVLTGADRDRIVVAIRSFKPPAAHPPLYGDGKAAAHCLKALLQRY